LLPGFGGVGDTERQVVYSDYKPLDRIQMPGKVKIISKNHVQGTVANEYILSGQTERFDLRKEELTIPEGYARQDFSYRKNAEVRSLGDGLFLVENVAPEAANITPGYPFSYNVVFAEFEDYVVVVEAPWSEKASQRVIDHINKTVPGKPIRYLAQTHHHDDHTGGIRRYVSEGVSIIASPSNVGFIRKIAEAPFVAYPDSLAKSGRKLLVEPVTNKRRVLKDKTNEALIIDIGPNTHSKENLVVYFPRQKVLYQADMFNEGEHHRTATTKEFVAKLKELKLDVETIVGTHGKTLEKEAVAEILRR
jgi:glyoxylase-like metal-dependent hydrolase (beta-lactamase superfamily II)